MVTKLKIKINPSRQRRAHAKDFAITKQTLYISTSPSVNATSQFYLEDPQFKSSQVDIRKVFHCDGLLLCSTEDDRLVFLIHVQEKPNGSNLETTTQTPNSMLLVTSTNPPARNIKS